MKNYNINANSYGLIRDVIDQVLYRAKHLPQGMQQNINIDVRGQQVSQGQLDQVRKRIVEKSNGLLRREHIEFRER